MPPRSVKPVAKAGAKKATPDFGGMDPALMMVRTSKLFRPILSRPDLRDWQNLMKNIPPNSVTGKTDLMDVVRYVVHPSSPVLLV